MRLSKPTLFIFLALIFGVIYVVQGKAVTTKQIVGSGGPAGSSATVACIICNWIDSKFPAGSSATVKRGGCEKQGVECKEGNNGGSEDTVLENEDYVYTNSLP